MQVPLHGDLVEWDLVHSYCYHGYNEHTLPGFFHQWHEMVITVTGNPPHGVTITLGNTSQSVRNEDANVCTSHSNKSRTIQFPPYGVSCLGIRYSRVERPKVHYELEAEERIALRYPVSLVIGLVLLFGAPSMCR